MIEIGYRHDIGSNGKPEIWFRLEKLVESELAI